MSSVSSYIKDVRRLIKREQHYIDLLKPKYNILKIAGSRLGAKHSEEVKAKIKAGALGLAPATERSFS